MASLVKREKREMRRKVMEPKLCQVTMMVREPITRSRSTPLLSPPPPQVCSAILKRKLTTNTGRKPKKVKAKKIRRSLRRGAKLIQSNKRHRRRITTFTSVFIPDYCNNL